ncbi:hypothetical protein [Streptomyces sp. NPDC001340]
MLSLMDKVLDRLVPKATASADTSYYKNCSACAYVEIFHAIMRKTQLCHVVGGHTSCGPCGEYLAFC